MPLIGINQTQEVQRKYDPIERVAQAFQIAQSALGTALAIPEFLQKKKAIEAEQTTRQAETASKLATGFRQLTPEEKQKGLAGQVFPGYESMGELVPKEQARDVKSEIEAAELQRRNRPPEKDLQEAFKKNYPEAVYMPPTIGQMEDFEKEAAMAGIKNAQDRLAKKDQLEEKFKKDIEERQVDLKVRYPFYNQIVAEEGTGQTVAGDQNLMISYAKFLNPNLRSEGLDAVEEVAGQSQIGRFKDAIRNIRENKTIPSDIRKEIFQKTHSLWRAHLAGSDRLVSQILDNAKKEGIDPAKIVINYNENRRPAPYGDTVIQNGATYHWNGFEYVQ